MASGLYDFVLEKADYIINTALFYAHKVPYSQHVFDYVAKRKHEMDLNAAAEAERLRLAEAAVARGEALSIYPDWCDHGSRLFAYACESYIEGPIWSTVFIADFVAVWLILCIFRRQWQQNREDKKARLSVPIAVRRRKLWGALAANLRLASFLAKSVDFTLKGDLAQRWKKAWDQVASGRKNRKDYIWKKDYDLGGTMGRAAGPLIQLACCIIILYETHGWYTLILPWYGLSPRLETIVSFITVVFPFRIYLDYFRTTFTDPGRPESISPRGSVAMENIVEGDDVELGSGSGSDLKRCLKCSGPKPPRCHHCKVCRRCVLKMDHHCPFVNNCVGLRNHRYFILFLLELVVSCSILVVLLLPQLWGAIRGLNGVTLAHRVHVIVVFAVALIAVSMLGPFFYFHMQLIVINETTLENMKKREKHQKDKLRQAQLRREYQLALKRGDEEKANEVKELAKTEAENVLALRKKEKEDEDQIRLSRSIMDNFSEVFGAPPARFRQTVEAVLQFFTPAPVQKRNA